MHSPNRYLEVPGISIKEYDRQQAVKAQEAAKNAVEYVDAHTTIGIHLFDASTVRGHATIGGVVEFDTGNRADISLYVHSESARDRLVAALLNITFKDDGRPNDPA